MYEDINADIYGLKPKIAQTSLLQ